MQGLLDDVAARIAPAHCPALIQVVTAMNAEAVVEHMALGARVSALVHPINDQASPIRAAGMAVSQQVTWSIGVTLALVTPKGFAQWETACGEIKGRLRGWAPPGASMPMTYAGGQNLSYSAQKDGGRWLWMLRFNVPSQESYAHQS